MIPVPPTGTIAMDEGGGVGYTKGGGRIGFRGLGLGGTVDSTQMYVSLVGV